jgi:hypothetical protein
MKQYGALFMVFFLSLLCVGGASAATLYYNQTLNASGAPLNVTFNTTTYIDQVVQTGTFVTLHNATINASGNLVTSRMLNFTTANTSADSSTFPAVTSATFGNIDGTIVIRSTLPRSSNVTVNVGTGGLTPGSLSVVQGNGTVSAPVFTFDTSTNRISFTMELSNGTSTVSLSQATTCTEFSAGERNLFFMGIVGGLILAVFLFISNPTGMINIGAVIGITIFIIILAGVMNGMC